jgi:hypothetical protein
MQPRSALLPDLDTVFQVTNSGYSVSDEDFGYLALWISLAWKISEVDLGLGGVVVALVRTEREELVDRAEGVDEFEEREDNEGAWRRPILGSLRGSRRVSAFWRATPSSSWPAPGC